MRRRASARVSCACAAARPAGYRILFTRLSSSTCMQKTIRITMPPRRPKITPSQARAARFYGPMKWPDAAARAASRRDYQPGNGVRGEDIGPRARGPTGEPHYEGFTVLTPRLHALMEKARQPPPHAEQPRERRLRQSVGLCYACGVPFVVGSVFAPSRRRYRWYCPPCATAHKIAPFPLAPAPVPLSCRDRGEVVAPFNRHIQ